MKEESILDSVKKNLGIGPDYTAFDNDLILLINSTLSKLNQLGVGPTEGCSIHSSSETWSLVYEDPRLNDIPEYVYVNVRMSFDPPQASVLSAFDSTKKELEWRILIAAEEIRGEE